MADKEHTIDNWHILGLPDLEITDFHETEVGDYIFSVKPKDENRVCDLCGSKGHVNRHTKRKVRDLLQFGHRVGIIADVQAYKCSNAECGHIWSDSFQSFYKSTKMTVRLRDVIKRESFMEGFNKVAETYGLEPRTVKEIFMEYADELREYDKLVAPDVLGIDELHLKKDYCGVFVSIDEGRVLELKQNRSKKTVMAFINSMEDRKNIKCVTMDMWAPYRDAVNETLPGVPVVVDKFHVIKELNKELDAIRSETTKKIKEKKDRVSLKNNRFLLLASGENLDKHQNSSLQKLLEAYPEFSSPYYLKEAFRNIYLCESRAEAEAVFNDWVDACHDAEVTGFDQFISMVRNWHTEIFNYFDYPYTNAETESLNRMIRDLDKEGRGYSFQVLRDKVVLRYLVPKKSAKFNF